MRGINRFYVRISRVVGESEHTDPYHEMDAHTISVDPAGRLSVQGATEDRAFSPGAWDALEVRWLPESR